MWNLQASKLVWAARDELKVQSADFQPDGEWIAVVRTGREATSQGALELLRVEDRTVFRTLELPTRSAGDVRVLRDGRMVVGSRTELRMIDDQGEIEWDAE